MPHVDYNGLMSFAVAVAAVVWGVVVFLECRAHRERMSKMEKWMRGH